MALTKVTGSVIKDSVSLSGNVSIGGTLTYEDVTNVDSVGVITARSTIDAQGDVSIADKIIHTGDTNTAIRFPAADTITAETNGSERLRIASSGQLKQTAASGDTIFTFKRSNTNTTGAVGVLNFAASDEHSVANIQVLGDGDNEGAHITFQTTSAATSADPFNAATVERLRITSGGNVGINQSSPTAKLEVVDSAYHQLYLKGSGTVGGIRFGNSGNQSGFIYYDNGPNLLFNVNNSEKVRITSSGNLLIGTVTPGYADLDDLTIATSGHTGITIRSGTSSYGVIGFADGTSGNAQYRGVIRYTHSVDSMEFFTADVERLRISSGGDFGIGTNSPQARLEIKDNSTNNYGTTIRLSQGYNSVFSEIASNFGGSMTLNAGQGGGASVMHFQVNDSEKMRLTTTGELGVNTTAPVEKLGISGNMRFVNPTGTTSRITALPSGSYNTGTSGGSAICFQRFADGGGGSDEIFFETHWQGNRHGESMRINKYGHVLKPNQPSFNVTIGGGQINSNVGVIVFTDTTTLANHNTGNHYNTSNGRFTAPVAGRYQINARMLTNSSTQAYTIYLLRVNGNHHGYIGHNHSDFWFMESGSWVLNLAANDYVDCYLQLHSGHGGFNYASFSGFLIG